MGKNLDPLISMTSNSLLSFRRRIVLMGLAVRLPTMFSPSQVSFDHTASSSCLGRGYRCDGRVKTAEDCR
jgi:hypothetical protein